MSALKRFLTSGGSNTFLALTAVSTTPAAGLQHVVGSFIIANVAGVAVNVDATVQNGGTDYYYCKGFPLAAGDSLFLHGLLGKVVLNNGDVLRVKCSVSGGVDVIVSAAEEP